MQLSNLLFLLYLSTKINASKFYKLFIRNEKVACSIHVSGTNKFNDLRVVIVQSVVSCHTQVTVDGTTEQDCAVALSISSQFCAVTFR